MRINKKLKHIIDAKIPEYLFKRYPYLIEFIHGFIDFVDSECAIDAMNLSDNLDPYKIFPKFLDSYFTQYCQYLIDTNKFQLTDENKRLFLSIIRFLNDNKGKRFSFDVALKYLTQFFVFDDETYFETIDYSIVEEVTNWHSKTLSHPYPDVTVHHLKPYTYIIRGDFVRDYVLGLVEKLNPVGFYPEFQFFSEFEETYYISDGTTETSHFTIGPLATETYYISDGLEETSHYEHLYEPKITETWNITSFPLLYNGYRTFSGSHKYDGIDGSVYNSFEILTYDTGSLIDTFNEE